MHARLHVISVHPPRLAAHKSKVTAPAARGGTGGGGMSERVPQYVVALDTARAGGWLPLASQALCRNPHAGSQPAHLRHTAVTWLSLAPANSRPGGNST